MCLDRLSGNLGILFKVFKTLYMNESNSEVNQVLIASDDGFSWETLLLRQYNRNLTRIKSKIKTEFYTPE